MSDDQVTIETPEHIEVQYELAGIGSRALAGIFDFVLQGTLTVLVVWGLIWLGLVLKLPDILGVVGAIVIASMGFLAFTVYYVTAEMLTGGQSPGKRLAGLRVIGVDGRPITFLQSVLRNVIRAVDMMPFFYSVGLVSVFASSRAQRLGDMVAGTIVVKERVYALPEQTAPPPARTPSPPPHRPPRPPPPPDEKPDACLPYPQSCRPSRPSPHSRRPPPGTSINPLILIKSYGPAGAARIREIPCIPRASLCSRGVSGQRNSRFAHSAIHPGRRRPKLRSPM